MRLRFPAVAGRFYPAEPNLLHDQIGQFLAAVSIDEPRRPKALIVPHAGYVYSGPVAASGYAWLAPWRDQIDRVILLGTCHTPGVIGLAATSAGAFLTPLGRVPIDRAAVEESLRFSQVQFNDEAQDRDHALEVQLPFLQVVLGSVSIIPFLVGNADAGTVAEVLDPLWNGDRTVIVVSSDLSHQHPYEEARRLDEAAAQRDRASRRSLSRPESRLRPQRDRRSLARRPPALAAVPDRGPSLLRRHRRPAPACGRIRSLGVSPRRGIAAEPMPAYRRMTTNVKRP